MLPEIECGRFVIAQNLSNWAMRLHVPDVDQQDGDSRGYLSHASRAVLPTICDIEGVDDVKYRSEE